MTIPARLATRVARNERGSMLLEVLIGAIIVAIAAVGVAVAFGAGQAYIDASGDDRASLALAQQELERRRSAGYHALTFGLWVEPAVVGHEDHRRVTAVVCLDPDDYTRQLEDCLPTRGEPWLVPTKEIIVTVSTPRNPKARTVTLRSVLAVR